MREELYLITKNTPTNLLMIFLLYVCNKYINSVKNLLKQQIYKLNLPSPPDNPSHFGIYSHLVGNEIKMIKLLLYKKRMLN
uniref:Uncharacterized protein n=1 Tax=Nyssomyia neivai TaxID=330878 RepID=A0A1L8D840_9DIPT